MEIIENFHLHPVNFKNIETLCKSYEADKNTLIKLSFSYHNYMFNSYKKLIDLGKKYNCEIIPSYGIITKQKIEFLILNPIGLDFKFIDKYTQHKIKRLINIFSKLKLKGYDLYINKMIKETEKYFYELDYIDITKELMNNDNFYSFKKIDYLEAFNLILKNILNEEEEIQPCVDECLSCCDNLYLVNPKNLSFIECEEIKGIISDYDKNDNFHKNLICVVENDLKKKAYYGSGEWI